MNKEVATLAALALTAAAAAIIPGKAYADDITIEQTPFVSTRSRADVKYELTGQDGFRSSSNEWTMQSRPLSTDNKEVE